MGRFPWAASFFGYVSVNALVDAVAIEIGSEFLKLLLKIARIPIEKVVQILSTDRADESFHEGMRYRYVWHTMDWFDLQDPEVCLPPVECEHRIVVQTEAAWRTAAGDDLIEHAAKRGPVHGSGLDGQADDPTRELVHDDENPVGLQENGLGLEQIQAPKAVFGMTQEGEP